MPGDIDDLEALLGALAFHLHGNVLLKPKTGVLPIAAVADFSFFQRLDMP